MPVDSFKYLPRLVSRYYKLTAVEAHGSIPWTPVRKPLRSSKIALVTSGGLYDRRRDQPFDLEREVRQPAWGDPSYRIISVDTPPGQTGASHHHINTAGVLADRNVLLPVDRLREFAAEGLIGSLAAKHYSFMGYQGFPSDLSAWRDRYGPEVSKEMSAEQVDCVLLTTA